MLPRIVNTHTILTLLTNESKLGQPNRTELGTPKDSKRDRPNCIELGAPEDS